jgi:aminoglycoside-2''-adenylyltransferase
MADLGRWRPLDLSAVVDLFRPCPRRWWICGGHALELFARRSWREHDDVDVGVLRGDVPGLRALLQGWDIQIAAAGVVRPWAGAVPSEAAHENNLWCRPAATAPWGIDIAVGSGDDASWAYRRDPSVRVPWENAVLFTADGVPYLAPELQLLFKSKNPRPKDDVDARVVIPLLDKARGRWLRANLPQDHPWRELLDVS